MFTPVYTLTPELLTTLTLIERLYGQLEALRIPKELELHLERKNLVQSSYASNKIEGNPLTMPEVTNLLLDDRVAVNRNEKEVVNYFLLLQKLPEFVQQPFTPDFVENVHAKLMEGVEKTAGKIRNVKVVVGNYRGEEGDVSLRVKHDPPYHTRKEIVQSLQELFTWLEQDNTLPTVIKSGIFHHQFVYIHPFEDGNGRVCRILTALIFLKDSYEINKFFILDDYYDIDRHQYSDKLHSADSGDKTQWLTYYAQGVMYSLQSALAKVKASIHTLRIDLRPTPKEREILEILKVLGQVTSRTVAGELHVSRQQAHALLRSLVEKNLLTKHGSTKSSFYEIR